MIEGVDCIGHLCCSNLLSLISYASHGCSNMLHGDFDQFLMSEASFFLDQHCMSLASFLKVLQMPQSGTVVEICLTFMPMGLTLARRKSQWVTLSYAVSKVYTFETHFIMPFRKSQRMEYQKPIPVIYFSCCIDFSSFPVSRLLISTLGHHIPKKLPVCQHFSQPLHLWKHKLSKKKYLIFVFRLRHKYLTTF